MNTNEALEAYRRETMENAPPIKIVRMLYEGALRFLSNAIEADPKDPGSNFVYWLWRTDAIVTELRCCLEPQHAPELCDNLEQLYLFAESRIAHAISERSPEAAEEAHRVLKTLCDGWKNVDLDPAA